MAQIPEGQKIAGFFKSHAAWLCLAFLAFLTHFAFLNYPNQVVFDEYYFSKFASRYFSHEYYFDIHPPLGKLMVAAAVKLAGYNPVSSDYGFFYIGEQFPSNLAFVLRFLPALFGAFFVLLVYWLASLFSRSKEIAFLAGFLVLFDNAILVQSKFTLMDIFLLFFGVLTLCFFFLLQRKRRYSRGWFLFALLTGVSFGLAISIKWTGLAVIGVIFFALGLKSISRRFADFLGSPERAAGTLSAPVRSRFFSQVKEALIALVIILVVGILVYQIPFLIHFKLLDKPGGDDRMMSQRFLQTRASAQFSPIGFWQNTWELNKKMLLASAGAVSDHPATSRWYQWPFDHMPVIYWSEIHKIRMFVGESAAIVLVGNPIIWLTALFAVLFTVFAIAWKKMRQNLRPVIYVLLFGYFANLLPFVLIKRDSFLYHYLPALIFADLLAAFWLEKLWHYNKKILLSLLILILLGFFFLAPLTYGWPLANDSVIQKAENNALWLLSRGRINFDPSFRPWILPADIFKNSPK